MHAWVAVYIKLKLVAMRKKGRFQQNLRPLTRKPSRDLLSSHRYEPLKHYNDQASPARGNRALKGHWLCFAVDGKNPAARELSAEYETNRGGALVYGCEAC
jgi:hypothetical protein